eukprot:3057812-Rhodomonas_salina.3
MRPIRPQHRASHSPFGFSTAHPNADTRMPAPAHRRQRRESTRERGRSTPGRSSSAGWMGTTETVVSVEVMSACVALCGTHRRCRHLSANTGIQRNASCSVPAPRRPPRQPRRGGWPHSPDAHTQGRLTSRHDGAQD